MKQHFSADYSVITFATNQLGYLEFAFTCARSVLLFNDINFYIVSNLSAAIPSDLKKNVFIIPAVAGHVAFGICIKLFTDCYLQTKHTLFIDSDCICYSGLDTIFNSCKNMDVTVAGNIVTCEDWCGPYYGNEVRKNFGIDKMIRFNGGLYYFKKTELTNTIFDKARSIEEEYHYGYDKITKKWINEEMQLSISMTLNKQVPIVDNGSFMTDLFTDRRPKVINVLHGARELNNPAYPSINHRPWYPDKYNPIILHFGGRNINSYPYLSQRWLLKLYFIGFPAFFATALVAIFVHLPYKCYYWFTALLNR